MKLSYFVGDTRAEVVSSTHDLVLVALVLLSGSLCASMRQFDRGQIMNGKAMV